MALRKRGEALKPEGCWPVPAFPHRVPANGEPGSFREDRGDRTHCGVDLYAPPGTVVVAVDSGTVAGTGISTSPEILPYWNLTRFLVIESPGGRTWRYGELAAVLVSTGNPVTGGQVIGTVGQVLNCRRVSGSSPPYIRALCRRGATSMLHLEMADRIPPDSEMYRGGNWFGKRDGTFPFRDPGPILKDSR